MNQTRHPLRLNVGFIVSQSVGYSRDFEFEYPQIKLESDLELFNFSGTASFGRTPQGLVCQAHFKADYATECVRCLGETVVTLQTEFDELYAFTTRTMSESGLILPEDAHIDLEPLLHEYFTIEIPIQPICKADCKGLCIVCGQNLNERNCEHHSNPAD